MLTLLVTLAVFGFVVWIITTYIPMPPQIKTIIIAIAVLVLVIWLLNFLGLVHTPLGSLR